MAVVNGSQVRRERRLGELSVIDATLYPDGQDPVVRGRQRGTVVPGVRIRDTVAGRLLRRNASRR